MGYFGMKLNAVKMLGGIFHNGHRTGRRAADNTEPCRQRRHFIAVAHPNLEFVRFAVVNTRSQRTVLSVHFGITEFALVAG